MSITAKQLMSAKGPVLVAFVNILKASEKLTGINDDNKVAVEKILTANSLKLADVQSTNSVGKARWDYENELKTKPAVVALIKSYETAVDNINAELEKIYGKGKGVRLQPYNRNLSNQGKNGAIETPVVVPPVVSGKK